MESDINNVSVPRRDLAELFNGAGVNRNALMVDRVYANLCQAASLPSKGGDFDFLRLSQEKWGFKNGERYLRNKNLFKSNIQRLASEVSVLYDSATGLYYVYNGKYYESVGKELLEAAYDHFVDGYCWQMSDNRQMREEFLRQIRINNLMSRRFDVMAFVNGVLDLRDYTFWEFSPKYHVTYIHPYEYNPRAKCTRWLNFLHEVLPDKNSRLTLQMFLGLGLIERGTVFNPYEGKDSAKVELCLILIGSGSNGKSVIYNTAMGIYGSDRISGIDYDDLTSPGDEGMRARRLLRDALFNWSSDSDARTFGRKRTGVFKRIVSGEPITDRAIGENVRENAYLPYLVFNLNELPYPDDQSLGFIRRLQFISFDVTIPKERQNKALSQELVSEYSGIFNWMLRGARELRRRKFIFPSSEGNRRHVLMAQLQTNPVLAWVNAYQMRCEPAANNEIAAYISSQVLLKSLEQFCEDNDVDMVSKQKFGQTMARIGKGFYKRRGMDGYKYQVFGCTEERLMKSFVIANEDMHIDYLEERGTYIQEDD